VWQVLRTSNGYRLLDPLDREPGRRGWFACKSENPARPQNRDKNQGGARLVAARVISEETSRAPPEPVDRAADALRREHGTADAALLSQTELAALIARMDAGRATAADWRAWERDLAARLALPVRRF
jgi:hypothetical protein